MTRFVVRRLAIIPIALFLAHFFGFAYAHLARPLRAARNPFLAPLIDSEPLLPTYFGYLQQIPESGLGAVPGSGAPLGEVVLQATLASLGLLSIALTLSLIVGWFLGMRAVRTNPPRVARWMTIFSTIGLATPSFYLGTLLIVAMFAYVIWRGPGTGMPFPTQGFGWDIHLVLPVVTLMLRPTAQIAVVISGLLVAELDKQYVVTARSLGHPWKNIRERVALRNIVAPVVLTIAGSARLLMAELIVVEWLFNWPGVGRLLASTLVPTATSAGAGATIYFLNPPLVAALVTVFAALFLIADLIASIVVRAFDPRVREPEPEPAHA